MKRLGPIKRRGGVLAYTCVSLVALTAFTSLGVDLARVHLAKSELQAAADSAARAGCKNVESGDSAVRTAAKAAAAFNYANGASVTIVNADIERGYWNTTNKTFTTAGVTKNAVRVTTKRTDSTSNAIPITFGKLIGVNSINVTASSIAYLTTDPLANYATNKSNPWLAGMPNGTTANGYDSAPSASPTKVGENFAAGQQLTFDVSGAASNQAGVEDEYEADGNLNWIIHNYPGNENGIADLKAPISSLVAVFLSDSQPNLTAAPASLDFTTSSSRDFSTLSPLLKQPFFIGDGKRANGTLQKFIVPAGATRLYIGSMDGQQWSDNAGGFTVKINGLPTKRVVTVK